MVFNVRKPLKSYLQKNLIKFIYRVRTEVSFYTVCLTEIKFRM